jgi:hypothetical protein
MTENKIERWISYAQWKADELNRLFKEQGVTGQLGRITAETIRRGMKLAALFLFALSVHAQAVISDFPVPVRTVTIGTTHCDFWFHASAAPGYDSEVACYQPNTAPLIQAHPAGVALGESFHFAAGDIAWVIKPNAADPTKTDYQISGQGTTDAVAVVETGTL